MKTDSGLIKKDVALFVTCVADAMYPQVGIAVVGVLRHLGYTVTFPPAQTCCGQPAFNAGHHEQTKLVAKNFIKAMENAGCIVCPSGSCAGMIRHTYLQLFAGDPVWEPRAHVVANKCYEFTEFLVRVLGVEDIGAVYPARATYHRSCHMTRLLGEREAPYRLLEKVQGLELIPLQRPQDCCGFGGTFSVKMPEISQAMVDSKVNDIIATGANLLIGADMACLMNISGRLHRRNVPIEVKHVAEVLWAGLQQAGKDELAAEGSGTYGSGR